MTQVKRRLTGEEMLRRTDIWIEKDCYQIPELKKYHNNPLIHALVQPQLWDIGFKIWRNRPPVDPRGRSLPNHQRLLLLLDALHFFEPLEIHEHLDFVINGLLFDGYLPRNPLGSGRGQTVREKLELIRNGQEDKLAFSPQPRVIGATLIAWPGMGKTASLRNKFNQQPSVILHNAFVDTHGKEHKIDQVQIPSMLLTCPEDGSTRSLSLEFFRQLDFLLGGDLYSIYRKKEYTKSMLMDAMAVFVKELNVGVLGFDELQRLSATASGGNEEMLEFFVRLMDLLPVPCVLVGTPRTESVLARLPHKIRRSDVLGDCRWKRLELDDNWINLVQALWPYQYLQKEVPLTEAYINRLYRMSQGIIDYAVKLYLLAQAYSITTGTEHLFSPDTFDIARSEYLFFAKEILEALGSGDTAKLTALELEDLRPIEMEQAIRLSHERDVAEQEALLSVGPPVSADDASVDTGSQSPHTEATSVVTLEQALNKALTPKRDPPTLPIANADEFMEGA
ncbi:MAG: ATP-binding protein [Geobacteraceae bacterium]|nr:ATP-binding protein [Geobacteraceae bacterium]